MIRLAHTIDVPVICTEQQNLGETVDMIRSEIQDVSPITKLSFSCFASESFLAQLKAHARRTLLLTGMEAHVCIVQTALAAPAPFQVHVVGDAVASRSPEDRQIALDRLRQSGVTVTSTEMLMYELLEKAGTMEFRTVLPLLKNR